MNIQFGNGKTPQGPGIQINLTGEEVATAIHDYIRAQNVIIDGPSTVMVNSELIRDGGIHVDPSGKVVTADVERSGKNRKILVGLSENSPITHYRLMLLGYKYHVCKYYCAPAPADGSTYRLESRATQFDNQGPVDGTEEWRAYLVCGDLPTIRRLRTLGELRDFHKGMCGGVLF